MRTVDDEDGVEASFERSAEVLLFDFGESFVVLDDFVALPVQLTAEDQVVERVREQVLDKQH